MLKHSFYSPKQRSDRQIKQVNPLSPYDSLKHNFSSLRTYFFSYNQGFYNDDSIKLVWQYMAILFIFSPLLNHLHPLQDENCDSNSRLVVDEDDNGKLRLQRVKSDNLVVIGRIRFNPCAASNTGTQYINISLITIHI